MNFCTLFDSNYLTRGLALWSSLKRFRGNDFHLWILCMDERVEDILRQMNLSNVTLVPLATLEDEGLLKAKRDRTPMEYCWTCTPILPHHLLNTQPNLNHIIYVDADVAFFQDPKALLNELGSRSVLIFEHKFPTRLRHQEETMGRFNVEVIVFRNDPSGRDCVAWWRERCIEWCYYRVEPGRMGDQKYLDEWPKRFSGVSVATDEIPAIAPWNLETYQFGKDGRTLLANGRPVLFYHFSKLSILPRERYRYCKGYLIPREVQELAYQPYTRELSRQYQAVRSHDPKFSSGIVELPLRELLGDWIHKAKIRMGLSQ